MYQAGFEYDQLKLVHGVVVVDEKTKIRDHFDGDYDHWWVEHNGLVIDITADQFNAEITGDENFPDILIEAKTECRRHRCPHRIDYNKSVRTLGGIERIMAAQAFGEVPQAIPRKKKVKKSA
jgi:hypothetical protein